MYRVPSHIYYAASVALDVSAALHVVEFTNDASIYPLTAAFASYGFSKSLLILGLRNDAPGSALEAIATSRDALPPAQVDELSGRNPNA